jgi:type VI secretion system protein ImpA
MNLDVLLAPIAPDQPSGPDLSYAADFLAMEQAAQSKPEQQFGDTVIAGEEADWRTVSQLSESLLTRSKDLRAAVLLARAQTRLQQIEGLSQGLALIHQLVSRYWDTLHPDLDREDNDDPVMRLNALSPLGDPTGFLRDVRNAVIVASPKHGKVAVRDVLIACGKLSASEESALTQGQISGVLSAVAQENAGPIEAAVQCSASAKALQNVLAEKGVLTQAPDLRPLNDMLSVVAPICAEALNGSAHTETVADGAGVALPADPTRLGGPIQSRADAVRALESVCRFIEETEPSNPAPLLIRRAQRLMSRSFIEIIQDLAPDSLTQIQKLAGIEKDEG